MDDRLDVEALLPPRCAASHALAASLSALLEGALARATGSGSGSGSSTISAADAAAEVHRARTAASLELLRLKQLNRELSVATEDVRRHTSAVRSSLILVHVFCCFLFLPSSVTRSVFAL